jgi:hypothetical protein
MTNPVYKDGDIVEIETGITKRIKKKARIVWESDNNGGIKMAFYEVDTKYRMYTFEPTIIK